MKPIKPTTPFLAPLAALFTALLLGSATASAPVDRPAGILNYGDLDAFATAIAAMDAGTEPKEALQRYMDGSSPGMQIFTGQFGTSAATIAEQMAKYPKYYRYLAGLRPDLEAREAELLAAISTLQASAPAGSRPVPVYFLVANMRAGGSPGLVDTPAGPRPAIGIAIDLMAQSERVDRSEFPGHVPGVQLAELPLVVLHEMSHIFQMQAQGIENYRSMYTDPSRATNLAFAVREGCADFLAWRASGWRLEDRHQYVQDHAGRLWAEFAPILHQPVDRTASWFGPRNDADPERPMQVGYGIGMQACEAFYESAADKSQALQQIHEAHLPEHFEAILAPYARRMNH